MSGGEQPRPEKTVEKITHLEEQLAAREKQAEAKRETMSGQATSEEKKAEAKPLPKQEGKAKAGEKKESVKAEKAEKPEKETKKREIVLERNYVVNLVEAYEKPSMFRSIKAMKILREFIARHMKTTLDKVKLAPELGEVINARGHAKPLKKIKVSASKDKEGLVLVKKA